MVLIYDFNNIFKTLISCLDRSPIHHFERELECDGDVIEYVRSSSSHTERLTSDLEQLASVEFLDQKKSKVRFKPNFKVSVSRLTVFEVFSQG